MNQITILGIIRKSWHTYKNNFNSFLQPIVISLLTSVATLIPASFTFPYNFPLLIVLTILSIAISIWLNVVFLQLGNFSLLGKANDLQSIYKDSWKRSPRYLWTSVLYGLIIFGGMILLIIPGIYFSVLYMFAQLEIAISEKMPTAKEALKTSKLMVSGRWWSVLAKTIIPAIFFTLIMLTLSFGLGSVITGGQVDFNELSMNFYFNILLSTISSLMTPLMILPVIIVFNEIKTLQVNTETK